MTGSVERRLGARLVARGGLAFVVVLLPALRLGWRGLGAALVAGGFGAATVVVQRLAVKRVRRGLSPTRGAAAASVAGGLLAIAAILQVAVLLVASGAGLDAQVEGLARLLDRSGEELAARAVGLLALGIVVGGALGGAALSEATRGADAGAPGAGEGDAQRRPSPSITWLQRAVGLATGLLVAAVGVGALRMDPFSWALPALFLVVALIAPLGAALLVVVPVALLELALGELARAFLRR